MINEVLASAEHLSTDTTLTTFSAEAPVDLTGDIGELLHELDMILNYISMFLKIIEKSQTKPWIETHKQIAAKRNTFKTAAQLFGFEFPKEFQMNAFIEKMTHGIFYHTSEMFLRNATVDSNNLHAVLKNYILVTRPHVKKTIDVLTHRMVMGPLTADRL